MQGAGQPAQPFALLAVLEEDDARLAAQVGILRVLGDHLGQLVEAFLRRAAAVDRDRDLGILNTEQFIV